MCFKLLVQASFFRPVGIKKIVYKLFLKSFLIKEEQKYLRTLQEFEFDTKKIHTRKYLPIILKETGSTGCLVANSMFLNTIFFLNKTSDKIFVIRIIDCAKRPVL